MVEENKEYIDPEEPELDSEAPKLTALQKRLRTRFVMGAILGVIAGIVITVGIAAGITVMVLGKSAVLNYTGKQKLKLLEKVIHKYYLWEDEIDDEAMQEGMYRGMVESLGDRYSVYYTKEEYAKMLESTSGTFEGVGLYLSQNPDTMVMLVTKAIPDGPADRAGVLSGDVLIKVNGEDVRGEDLSLVVSNVKGEAGTSVNLTFLRNGKEVSFDMKRETIERETILSEMKDEDNKIGYIYISEFDTVTSDQFLKALENLKSQGMKALIIDVRDNPGGNLQTVCEICDDILPEGLIVYVEDKEKRRKDYESEEGMVYDGPIVLLTNGNSASAAEVLTGALKDYGRATVVGTTTFGKGIVQTLMPLGDGTAIKITVEDYYTPSGNNIHGVGVKPDVEIELNKEAYIEVGEDNQLDKALELARKKLK